jgi:hypothetical protein
VNLSKLLELRLIGSVLDDCAVAMPLMASKAIDTMSVLRAVVIVM